jgi:hypothetical protein
MSVWVAEAHAHVQRLVSVVKIATMLGECTTEEQRSVVRFMWAEGYNAKIFLKRCFLFTVGSACPLTRFSLGTKCFAADEVETEAETTGRISFVYSNFSVNKPNTV